MAKAVCSLLLLPLSGTGGLCHIYCDCMGTCSTFSGAGSRDECYRGAEIRPDLGLLSCGDVGSRLRNSEHTLCRCLGGSNAAPFINTVGGAGGYRARGSRLPASCLSRTNMGGPSGVRGLEGPQRTSSQYFPGMDQWVGGCVCVYTPEHGVRVSLLM